MPKRLILMRHAKAGWDGPHLSDIERPLNARGRADAARIGAWLRQEGYLPDAVLCSAATRTRETLSRLGVEAETEFLQSLYLAPEQVMLKALKAARADTVLMLGHNPGIGLFAQDVVAEAPSHPKFRRYPTAATLVCDLPVNDWADAVPRSAQVVDFIVPRDLP
ncbi:SixA phosphatase family protein [Thalassorhabdomicrobium marinisediminis]|uniref:Phosphoglycerate mutase n=1 Tax=Thalassorhabdomicrobium marinisediminis TaxID=2170577 RepID=A0A2T7FWB5_9RHOB|nr:histidine phosphatase family protein [Thalassorhabdomicrobium marinisediminis]PVA06461.1 phosphoglycerate mutase [Thalassorhabdomicrobium marinisediminis]